MTFRTMLRSSAMPAYDAPNDPPAPPAPPPGDVKPWYDGADQETIGHIQTKGWHDKPANVAALEAIKAHREAEKFVGAPADKILKLPDATDSAGWDAVWKRLGRPEKAEDYDFSTVKRGEKPLEQADVDFYRAQALAMNLNKEAAVKFVQEMVARDASTQTTADAAKTAALTAAQDALKKNWGANFDANKFVAGQAAAKLGVTEAEIAALESVVGYDRVMEMFRDIGSRIGEDKFLANPNPSIPGVMTQDQALAKMSQLKSDTAWRDRYLAGGSAERAQMDSLVAIIAAS